MLHSPVPTTADQFPLRSFRVGLILMIALMLGSMILNWRVGQNIRSATDAQVKVLVAAERVRHYGNVLEMAVKAVVADGSPEAAAKYRAVQPELRQILIQLRNDVEGAQRPAVAEIDRADLALVAMEYQALDLANRGDLATARTIIDSPRYGDLVDVYLRGVDRIERQAVAYATSMRRQLDVYLWAIILMSGASLALVLAGWFAVMRPVRRWGAEIERARNAADLSSARLRDKQRELEQLNDRLFKQARVDPLTGLSTRLRFNEDAETLRAGPDPAPNVHCAVMCDIDWFKQYNDSCGHLGGDRALRLVAGALKAAAGADGHVYRLGGEEFLVLLQAASAEAAAVRADHLRAAVADLKLPHPASPLRRVTISMGVAALAPGSTIERWLRDADDALYAAKSGGRNRVSVAAAEAAPA